MFGLTWQDLQNLGKKKEPPKKKPVKVLPKSKYFPIEEKEEKENKVSQIFVFTFKFLYKYNFQSNKKLRRYQRELLGELSKDLDYLEVLAAEVKLVPDLDSGGQKVKFGKMLNLKPFLLHCIVNFDFTVLCRSDNKRRTRLRF